MPNATKTQKQRTIKAIEGALDAVRAADAIDADAEWTRLLGIADKMSEGRESEAEQGAAAEALRRLDATPRLLEGMLADIARRKRAEATLAREEAHREEGKESQARFDVAKAALDRAQTEFDAARVAVRGHSNDAFFRAREDLKQVQANRRPPSVKARLSEIRLELQTASGQLGRARVGRDAARTQHATYSEMVIADDTAFAIRRDHEARVATSAARAKQLDADVEKLENIVARLQAEQAELESQGL